MAQEGAEDRLWSRLSDEPADREAAQMLADALQTHADAGERALGELIALELELARDPRWRRRLLRDATALRQAHAAALLGPLATLPPLEHSAGVRVSCTWGPLGIEELTLFHELRAGDTVEVPRLLDEALALPALRLISRLTINLNLFGAPLGPHSEVVEVLGRRAPPALRELTLTEIGDPWDERIDGEPCHLAPLSSLPRLTTLHVVGREVVLDGLALPTARSLRLEGRLPPTALAALAAQRWPALESLRLGFDAELEQPPLAPLRALLDGRRAPRLRAFSLDTYGPPLHGPVIAAAIAEAPQLPRLTELAIDRVDDATAATLLARRSAFAHLHRLRIEGYDRRPTRLKGICRHVDADEHRLERDSDGRFAEIEIDEPRVRIREGRIGQPGRLRVVDGGWPGYHAEIAARHLDGYRTVRAPFRARSDEVANDELWRAILRRPDDPAPYLAYAGWIRIWGAIRAELIAVACARAERPDDARLVRREAELLSDETTATALLGELRPHVAGTASPTVTLDWRFGFVRAAVLSALPGDNDAEAAAEVVELLLEHPSGRLVEELTLSGLSTEAVDGVRSVIAAPRARRVRLVLAGQ